MWAFQSLGTKLEGSLRGWSSFFNGCEELYLRHMSLDDTVMTLGDLVG